MRTSNWIIQLLIVVVGFIIGYFLVSKLWGTPAIIPAQRQSIVEGMGW